MTNTFPWRFLRAGLLVAAVTLAGCTSATEDASPTPALATDAPAATSEPSSASADSGSDDGSDGGEATSVFDLEVGDCFSVDADELLEVTVVDCEQSHEYEVFSVLDHDAGDDDAYPGDHEMLELAVDACTPAFEEFVGHDYQTSIWYITPLTPSTGTWAEGDREIVCTVNQQDDDLEPISVTDSAEGAAE